jgi:nucleotide-binding universal stress UspA family protein
MYRRIALTYFGPSFSAAALEQATVLARTFDAELHLLCVVTTATEVELARAGGMTGTLEQQKKRSLLAAKNQAQRLREKGITVSESACEGDPAIEIGLFVHRVAADLLVMSNGDKASLARWLKSETGSKLLAHLPCSVLFP